MVSRRVSRAVAVLSLAWAAQACASVLGIEELPAGDDGGVAIDSSVDAAREGGVMEAGADAAVASDAANDGACAMGDLSCSDAQPQICAAGGWKNVGAACSGAMPACLGGACVACGPGTLGCSGQQPQTCDGTGAWQNTGSACANQACVNGTCQGNCTPGSIICVSSYIWFCTGAGAWALNGARC